MSQFSRLAKAALGSVLLCGSTAAFAVETAAPHWQVLQEKSSIEWSVNYGGKPVTGAFKEFASDIVFDPEHLDMASVAIKVPVAKVTSEDKDAAENLPSAEWFDAEKFPLATFEATKFRHVSDEKYEAEGTLTIGEKHTPLVLPFTAHFYDDKEAKAPVRYAQVTAETKLKRTELGVGKGEWTKTDTVADEVKIIINLKAEQSVQPSRAVP